MAETATDNPTIAWHHPSQLGLIRSIAGESGLSVVAAGTPEGPPRPTDADADRWPEGVTLFSDLRQQIASGESAFLLASAPIGDVGEAEKDQIEIVRLCRSRGIRLITLEPIPSSVSAWRAIESSRQDEEVLFLPRFTAMRSFIEATELFEAISPIRTVSISLRCGASQTSLASRLLDAAQIVLATLGEPETIDAAVITTVARSGLHLAPAATLDALQGDLTANIRFAGPRAATLTLSDHAGQWFRGVTIRGEKGTLRIGEGGFDYLDQKGEVVDTWRQAEPESPSPGQVARAMLGEQLSRFLDPHIPRPNPIDMASALAICEAAVLSARTGQSESPATMLRMARTA